MKMWKYLALFALVASVKCGPVQDGAAENLIGAVSECIENDTSLCLKEKALKYTERLAVTKDVSIFDGMTLINTGSARSARNYEPLAEDPKTREMQLEERIANNIGDFLDNHVLQLRLTDQAENESRDLDEEARGKKKKKIKQLLPLLLLFKLKLAALIPLFLGIIAFAALKAIFLGKIMFAMNAVNLIRKLFAKNGSSGGSSISYSAPHHHEEHPGYNYEPAQGWSSRQTGDAHSLAYGGQL
ncbi:unnamed protein product [Chilo suppressalis]|uniref:Osiris 9 n=1 Tax=Chilo suppressalis TaxID=168631 RepID=A0ABN8B2M1_CHISP|nr:hypothetical protein evm_011475 [Chilo suppressalis]CAH0401547.1 unnamed protein product [Chilo suppressalis]